MTTATMTPVSQPKGWAFWLSLLAICIVVNASSSCSDVREWDHEGSSKGDHG